MKKVLYQKLKQTLGMKSFFILLLVLLNSTAQAQNLNVSGTVKSATDNVPMIGVTVMITGSSTGTVTDLDGNYALRNVPAGATLQFSYVGYVSQKISVNGQVHINVTMHEDSKTIDEIVVIGYGVQSSNGSSNPLYIVDGLKVSDISYLDPSSIKSMEILKDAASAAIYGAEAGNGVILITTKNGDKGKTKISFDAQWTFSSLSKKIDLMNAEQFKKFYSEGAGETFTQLYNTYNIEGTDTDWQDEMYETGKIQKYNLGLQGGNDQGTFFMTIGYMNNDGMIKMDKDYYQRVTAQINASYKLRPWLEVGTSNTLTHSKSSTLSEDSRYGLMRGIVLADPLTPVYYNTLPSYMENNIANGMHPIQAADVIRWLWSRTRHSLTSVPLSTA